MELPVGIVDHIQMEPGYDLMNYKEIVDFDYIVDLEDTADVVDVTDVADVAVVDDYNNEVAFVDERH